MNVFTSGRCKANGLELHYLRSGAGHTGGGRRPVLLLLHGITDNGLCWMRVAQRLQGRYDLVMPDARGHGFSDWKGDGLAVRDLAADVAGLIEALGLERPLVYGHSMGARTALELAASRPGLVRAIILEDPPLFDLASQAQRDLKQEQANHAGFRELIARLKALPAAQALALGAETNPGWHADEIGPWVESKVQAQQGVLDWLGTVEAYAWRERLAHLETPGLLLTGDPAAGAIVTAETAAQAASLWRGGRVAHIPGAGHCIHRDRFEETMRVVEEFLSEKAL